MTRVKPSNANVAWRIDGSDTTYIYGGTTTPAEIDNTGVYSLKNTLKHQFTRDDNNKDIVCSDI